MRPPLRRQRFGDVPSQFDIQMLPVATTLLASMAPIAPIIATAPVMPPLGLMTALAWRIMKPGLWPAWAALPMGLFDDMFSGQPLGSAMLLWTVAFLLLDMIDTRPIWRDYWQDWGIASALTAAVLAGMLVIARATGGGATLIDIVPQIAISVLVYPLVVLVCATLDRWRFA